MDNKGSSSGPRASNRGNRQELQPVPGGTGSPFDALRQVDEDGEFWSARDVMPHLDYGRWQRFEDAVERAKMAAKNSGADPDSQFRAAAKITSNARGQHREVADYRLTRHAAYLLAMNSDPRKTAVAEAQTYFAHKTREAELATAHQIPGSFAEALELAAKQQRDIDEQNAVIAGQQKELAANAPKVQVFDAWFDPDNAVETTDFAKRLGMRSAQELNKHMQGLGIVRRDRHPRTGKRRNLPTADWGHCFKVVPTKIPTGGFVDVAWILPEGQLEIVEELRNNGVIDF